MALQVLVDCWYEAVDGESLTKIHLEGEHDIAKVGQKRLAEMDFWFLGVVGCLKNVFGEV